VKSEGTSRVITIHGEKANMNIPSRVVPADPGTTGSTLIVRRSVQGRQLEGIYVEQLNATLYMQSDTIHGMIDHLPIS
jgi:hypothetical protein